MEGEKKEEQMRRSGERHNVTKDTESDTFMGKSEGNGGGGGGGSQTESVFIMIVKRAHMNDTGGWNDDKDE